MLNTLEYYLFADTAAVTITLYVFPFVARRILGAFHQERAFSGHVRHRRPHGRQQLQLSYVFALVCSFRIFQCCIHPSIYQFSQCCSLSDSDFLSSPFSSLFERRDGDCARISNGRGFHHHFPPIAVLARGPPHERRNVRVYADAAARH